MRIKGLSASQGLTVLLLSSSGFASSINLRSMDTLLPSLAADFGVSVGQASWAISAYAIGYGLCQLLVGAIGDRLGKYRVIIALCLLSAVACVLASLAGSIGQLVAARLFAGVAVCGIVPLALAWIGDEVPMDNRQAVMARYMSGNITGVLLGPAVGGLLAEYFGWRSAMLVFAACFFLVAAALALGAGTRKKTAAVTRGKGVLAHLADLRGNRYALTVLGGVAIEGTAIFAVLSFTGASLHQRFNIGLGAVGLLLACYAAGGLIYSFSASTLLRRFTTSDFIRAGGFFSAAGLTILGVGPWLWLMPIGIVALGLGFYLLHTSLQVHATQILPTARGTGLAFFATCFFLAQSLGVFLAAPVVDSVGLLPVCLASAVAMICVSTWLSSRLAVR